MKKIHDRKYDAAALIIVSLTIYSFVAFASVPVGGYRPGQTLDPECGPYDTDCSVQGLVNMSPDGSLALGSQHVGINTDTPEFLLDVHGTFQSEAFNDAARSLLQVSENLFGFMGAGVGFGSFPNEGFVSFSVVYSSWNDGLPLIQLSTNSGSVIGGGDRQSGIHLDAVGDDARMAFTLATGSRNTNDTPLVIQLNDTDQDRFYGFSARPTIGEALGAVQVYRSQRSVDDVYYVDRTLLLDDQGIRLIYTQDIASEPASPNNTLTINDRGLSFQANAGSDHQTGFVATPEGKFGVGTTNPTYPFTVVANTAGSYAASFINNGNASNRYGIQVQAGSSDRSGTTYYFNALDAEGRQIGYLANNDGTFGLADISDARTKTNIENTNINAVDIINNLRVVDFNRRDNPSGPLITGFVAQEAQEVYPPLVVAAPNGYLAVMKEVLIPVLTKAVQELDLRLDAVEAGACEPDANLFDRLVLWFGDATNSIEIFFAGSLHARTEICIEDVCINRDQLRAMIKAAEQSATEPESQTDPASCDAPTEPPMESDPQPDESPEPVTTDPIQDPVSIPAESAASDRPSELPSPE